MELIVTIVVIGVLVMLASPRFLGRTKEATLAKHLYNVKTLEDTMDRYILENDRFPRLSEEAYTSEEVEEYANRIRDLTGEEVTLDPEGKYYDIDYVTLKDYVKVPDKADMPNYILQNPVGKVFFLEELTEVASVRADFTDTNPINKELISNGYTDEKIQQIQNLIDRGFVPIANSEELDSLRHDKVSTFGKNTKWSGEYTGGPRKNYIQVADIDMSPILNFEPLPRFTGIFNGSGFAINNLKINNNSQKYVGLFSETNGATIRNVEIVNHSVVGGNETGALIGYVVNSHISDSYSKGHTEGYGSVGGLIGRVNGNGSISKSYTEGSVYLHPDGDFIGGLMGWSRANISESYSITKITGNSNVGGLVGAFNWNGSISNSYAQGEISVNGRNSNVGGLVGTNYSRINRSYAAVKINPSSNISNLGGLVGKKDNDSSVSSSYGVGSSYYDITTTGKKDSGIDKGIGLTTLEMKDNSSILNFDFNKVWQVNAGEYPTLQWQK